MIRDFNQPYERFNIGNNNKKHFFPKLYSFGKEKVNLKHAMITLCTEIRYKHLNCRISVVSLIIRKKNRTMIMFCQWSIGERYNQISINMNISDINQNDPFQVRIKDDLKTRVCTLRMFNLWDNFSILFNESGNLCWLKLSRFKTLREYCVCCGK